jgi:hypothetical protein
MITEHPVLIFDYSIKKNIEEQYKFFDLQYPWFFDTHPSDNYSRDFNLFSILGEILTPVPHFRLRHDAPEDNSRGIMYLITSLRQ